MTIEERRYKKLEDHRMLLTFLNEDGLEYEKDIPNDILFEIANKNLTNEDKLKILLGKIIFKNHSPWIIETLLTSEEYIIIDHYLDSYPDLVSS